MKDEPRCADTGEWRLFTRSKPLARSKAPEQADPAVMAAAIRALPRQKLPSEVVIPGLLEGLPNVARLVAPWIMDAEQDQSSLQALER